MGIRRTILVFLLLACWAVVTPRVFAQELEESPAQVDPAVSSTQADLHTPDAAEWERRVVELERWMAEYAEWKAWAEKWRNKLEPNWVGFRERRQRPDPPQWLFDDCAMLASKEGLLGKACDALADWKTSYGTAVLREQVVAARAQREAPTKSLWWEHVHLDMLWPMPQLQSGVYGVIGVHAAVEVAGRFQVFVAPGAMLVRLPNGPDSGEWQPAADWGVGYRLADFNFPGTDRRASLHFNLAKAWILAGQQNLMKSSIDLAGFSITFKKSSK